MKLDYIDRDKKPVKKKTIYRRFSEIVGIIDLMKNGDNVYFDSGKGYIISIESIRSYYMVRVLLQDVCICDVCADYLTLNTLYGCLQAVRDGETTAFYIGEIFPVDYVNSYEFNEELHNAYNKFIKEWC